MKAVIRRLDRLENRFGLAKETEQDRILARRLEAARPRVGKLATSYSDVDRGGTLGERLIRARRKEAK